MSSANVSSNLNTYIRVKIGEAKSKEEEDKAVIQDLEEIKQEILKPNLADKAVWEIILKVIYADMLGHNTEFAHPFVVNSAQRSSYKVKRIAYLACIILLEPDSLFRIMMVASLQKDLTNTCLYNKIIALNTLNKILCPLNATAFIDSVLGQLTSAQAVIRKKAILCAVRLEEILPGSIESFDDVMERGLRDNDASIMMATLPYYFKHFENKTETIKKLLPAFIKIYMQLIEGKLGPDYYYENYAAPWTLIKILQLFKFICRNDKARSDQVFEVLSTSLKSFFLMYNDVDITLLYQTIMTTIQIYPFDELIKLALEKIELILKNTVLKRNDTLFLTLKILSKLIDIDVKYTANYQLLLLDCLDSADETLRQLTVDILFKNITPVNLSLVITKIQQFILTTTDTKFKKSTVAKYFQAIETHAPDSIWYLNRCMDVIDVGLDCVNFKIVNSVIRNIKEIIMYEETNKKGVVDGFMRVFQSYLESKNLNDAFSSIFMWFFAEYLGVLVEIITEDNVFEIVDYVFTHKYETDRCYSYLYSSLEKIKCSLGSEASREKIRRIMQSKIRGGVSESQMRLSEYLYNRNKGVLFKAEQIDVQFGFLDDFVKKSMMKGGKTFDPKQKEATNMLKDHKEPELQIKYTKEQIDKNLKKEIDDTEKIFKFKGNAKWSDKGHVANILEEGSKMKIDVANFHSSYKLDSGDGKVPSESKKEENPQTGDAKKKTTKKKVKKDSKKDKLASSLFGGEKFELSKELTDKSKQGFFGLNKAEAPKPQVRKQTDDLLGFDDQPVTKAPAKPNNEDLLDFGLDNLDPQPTTTKDPKLPKPGPAPIVAQNPKPQEVAFAPLSISVNDYAKFWDQNEKFEKTFELKKKLSFSQIQGQLKAIGVAIIDVVDHEILSAVKSDTGDKTVFLYIQWKDTGSHEVIIRGDAALAETLTRRLQG